MLIGKQVRFADKHTQHRTPPMFTQFHIRADHARPYRTDIARPHWVCQTQAQADKLAQALRRMPEFQNVKVTAHTWGNY